MKHTYKGAAPFALDPTKASVVTSTVEVTGISHCLRDVNVSVDIQHTHTADLTVSLTSPQGRTLVLFQGQGEGGDDIRATFDDAALTTIVEGAPPYAGRFRPVESLGSLDNDDPNGVWTLTVEDSAAQDGGQLNGWSITIEDGVHRYESAGPVDIPTWRPNTRTSSVVVTGLGAAVLASVKVEVDITHTWDGDLSLVLEGPDGTSATLFARRGGGGDDIRATFSDRADIAVSESSAPFDGPLRPDEALSVFKEKLASGTWTLSVSDHAAQDGGRLNSWALIIDTHCATPRTPTAFTIDVRFRGGLSPAQRSVFALAAARWAEVIIGDLPAISLDGEAIDDLVIYAEGSRIDGVSGVLGQAGPTYVRPGSNLPITGEMVFDAADLEAMETDGSLLHVIVHEMGHVLGLGTLWGRMGLIQGSGTQDPQFIGPRAMFEYAALVGADEPQPVPLANTGGPGTAEGHWRESALLNELMTGYVDPGANPLSRLTVAALEDMGYIVNYDAAEAFIPGALMGFVSGQVQKRALCGRVVPTQPIAVEEGS